MKKIFLIPLFVLMFGLVFAQPVFFKTYGTGGKSSRLTLTTDGGYMIVGSTFFVGNNSTDIYLLKIDALGDTIWTRTYGGVYLDKGFAVQETYDGGYIIGAQIGVPDTISENLADIFVLKTNVSGDTDWTFRWDPGSGDRAYSVQQTADSSYIIAGVIDAGVNGNPPAAFLLKLNSEGDSLWTHIFESRSIAASVKETLDGGYIFVGRYEFETYLVKVNAMGEMVWTKKGNLGFQYGGGADIIQLADSSFVITGSAYNGLTYDMFLGKTDKFGNSIWTAYFGGDKDDYGSSLDMTADGGFIITGATFSYSPEPFTNPNVWLIRTDKHGDMLWTKNYGDSKNESPGTVKTCPDGGFAITGNIGFQTSNLFFLLKTDSLGNGPFLTPVEDLPQNKNTAINVFPNPSKDEIRVEFEVGSTAVDVQFTIYDSEGRIRQQFNESSLQAGENYMQINIADLPQGQYFLRIYADGITQLARFLKF